jgi:nucleotide-binding universal stress UspA family protein
LLSAPAPLPQKILVCVAVGEPGKEDVSFAERVAWRLQAQVTVLTVLDEAAEGRVPDHVRRFLAAAARALGRRGVEVQTRIRFGPARREILAEVGEGGYGLLVVGAPVPTVGHGPLLTGLVTRLLAAPCPLLVVRGYREVALPPAALLGRAEDAAGGAA